MNVNDFIMQTPFYIIPSLFNLNELLCTLMIFKLNTMKRICIRKLLTCIIITRLAVCIIKSTSTAYTTQKTN
jgi:hypothetical protein